MAAVILTKRVHKLEDLMAKLIVTVDRTDRQLAETARQHEETERQARRTERSVERLSEEMREFKQDMRNNSEETREFKQGMRNNMEKFTQGIENSRRESRAEIKDMRKQWGELSNKMGTMAEDLVAPSVGRILKETVGDLDQEIDFLAVRVKKRHPETGHNKEYDVVAVCGEYLLINETKGRLAPEDVKEFVTALSDVRGFFPEYADKQVIGALASLYVEHSLVRCGERAGLIVLGFGEDVMDVLNSQGFVPKSF